MQLGSAVEAKKINHYEAVFQQRTEHGKLLGAMCLRKVLRVQTLSTMIFTLTCEHAQGKVLQWMCRSQPWWRSTAGLESALTRIRKGNTRTVKLEYMGPGGRDTVGSRDTGLTGTVASTLLRAETEHFLVVMTTFKEWYPDCSATGRGWSL